MKKYELHPLCTLFPRMASKEAVALRDDIAANGLRSPIVLHDGLILDGGNRYRACLDAGIEPTFSEFDGDSLVSFVLSANLHRRHMTAGQQAAIVASAQDWAKAQGVGKPQSGKITGLDRVQDRAKQSGASDKTQRFADKVAREAPELAKQVGHGEISLPAAVEQITGKRPGAKPHKNGHAQPAEHFADSEEFGPSEDEIRSAQQEDADELASLRRIAESDDQIKAALAEAKRFREENRILTERIRGLMNEKNEAIRQAKHWQRMAQKAEKTGAMNGHAF